MSGRGKGRGRGRGCSSIDLHQLGFASGDALPAPVLQPPPVFPPLENKPVPLKLGPEGEYMIALKRDLVEYLRYVNSLKQNNESSSSSSSSSSSVIERFSDKYQAVNSDSGNSWDSQFHWDRIPLELHPLSRRLSNKRKLVRDDKNEKSKKSAIDISCKLEKLAKLEEKDEEESDEPKEVEEKEQVEENDEEGVEEEDDEEMDDGTDYLNNYFDNGESYFEDEDDKLDDGPIY